MKRLTVFTLITIFTLMLTGCGNDVKHASETLYGQVQSVDGKKVTLLLGTVSEMSAPVRDEGMGGEGEGEGFTQFGDSDTEEGTDSGQNTNGEVDNEVEDDNDEGYEGENQNSTQPPQDDGNTDRQPPQGGNGRPQGGSLPQDGQERPSGQILGNFKMYVFTAGEETITIDPGDLSVGVGNILKIVYDEKGKISIVEAADNVIDPASMNNGAGLNNYGQQPSGQTDGSTGSTKKPG